MKGKGKCRSPKRHLAILLSAYILPCSMASVKDYPTPAEILPQRRNLRPSRRGALYMRPEAAAVLERLPPNEALFGRIYNPPLLEEPSAFA